MSWTSCCRGRRSNCPSVAVEDDFLLIKDDDGAVARIKLTSVQDFLLTIQELVHGSEEFSTIEGQNDTILL